MKFFKLGTLCAAALLASNAAHAGWMYIDVGTNQYETDGTLPSNSHKDANTTTGLFNEFGFNQILTTSIYDLSNGNVFGTFYDTNIPAELNAAGVPSSGLAFDGVTPVDLVLPDCGSGQCDIDAFSPLNPPLNSDSEGFLGSWDLQVSYHFDGYLDATGPHFTGGYMEIFFNDLIDDSNDRSVLKAAVTGSDINAANLDIYFDIIEAEAGFLYIQNSSGQFVDANEAITPESKPKFHLDTNVNPPIPSDDQLLVTNNGQYAVRQTTLDGSITASIPEPASIAVLGAGLLGLGFIRRRRFDK